MTEGSRIHLPHTSNSRTIPMHDNRLTCLVPTHNRPQFLRRLMRFFVQVQPQFLIRIIDSSEGSAATENRSIVDDVSHQLQVDYQNIAQPFYEKISTGLASVTSPFVAMCADDDCLFPETVTRSVDFLEHEPTYESAMGHKAQLNTTKKFWPGSLKVLKGYSIDSESVLDRCRLMATQWYSNFYAVYRTPTLLHHFRIVSANSSPKSLPQLPEMLMSQFSVLRGRAKVLPMMYSIWQRHETNWTNMVAKALQSQPELHYEQFRACLLEQMQLAGIDRAEAERLIGDWYGHYRFPEMAKLKRRLSVGEQLSRSVRGFAERFEDFVRPDQVRHCRSVRSRDLVGCQSSWQAAVNVIREYPQGILCESDSLKRCA